MIRCHYSSTCNYPEGECAGDCLRLMRLLTEEQRMPIEFAPGHENEVKEGRFSAAWDAYKTHRALGRIRALRIAIRRAWRN